MLCGNNKGAIWTIKMRWNSCTNRGTMGAFLLFTCQLNHDIACSNAAFVPVNVEVAFDTLGCKRAITNVRRTEFFAHSPKSRTKSSYLFATVRRRGFKFSKEVISSKLEQNFDVCPFSKIDGESFGLKRPKKNHLCKLLTYNWTKRYYKYAGFISLCNFKILLNLI